MARIVFTLEDGTEIETELDSDVITVGRHPDSIVVLPSASVSSHHAIIKRRGESYYVQDLGTTNGTRLNGVEVEEAKLEDGDQLTFGDIPAAVHYKEPTRVVLQPLPSTLPPPVAQTRAAGPVRPGRHPVPRRGYARPQQQYQESSGCAGFLFFLVFLVVAFVIGLHVRHAAENSGSILLVDVLKKLRDDAPDGMPPSTAPANVDPAVPGPTAPGGTGTTPSPAPSDPATPPGPPPAPQAPAPGASMMGN